MVRETLQRPSLAGLVEHDGVTVGRVPGEPIIDEDTFGQIRALFAGRRRGRIPGERYVGSGIVLCGREGCGRSLSGCPHNGTYPDGQKRRQYHCNKQKRGCGSVAGDARAVDQRCSRPFATRVSELRFSGCLWTSGGRPCPIWSVSPSEPIAATAARISFVIYPRTRRVRSPSWTYCRVGLQPQSPISVPNAVTSTASASTSSAVGTNSRTSRSSPR